MSSQTWGLLLAFLSITVCDSHLQNGIKDFTTTTTTTSAPPGGGDQCPIGYVEVENKCFKVVNPLRENAVSWNEARELCTQEPGTNSSLATVTSLLQHAVIVSQLMDHHLGIWIGLYRYDMLPWRWQDDTPYDYQNWAPGKPEGLFIDNCVEMWNNSYYHGQWNNIACTDRRGYVCQTSKDEYNSSLVPTSPALCPGGYTEYWGSCYRYVNLPLTWKVAQEVCISEHGATLTSIHSTAENAAIQALALTHKTPVWIGFNDMDYDGEYSWINHWYVSYTNWAANCPYGRPCVLMDVGGHWIDTDCEQTRAAPVCKLPRNNYITTPPQTGGYCPEGEEWVAYGDSCYLFVHQYSATWNEARLFCAAMGTSDKGHLASIHSLAENNFIFERIIQQHFPARNPTSLYWIGFFRHKDAVGSNKDFLWVDESPVQFTHWAAGEPKTGEDGEMCVQMLQQSHAGTWRVDNCTQATNFICKMPKLEPMTTLGYEDGYCPSDSWEHFGPYCYLFQPLNPRPFYSANKQCQELGGSNAILAPAQSQQEYHFIYETMKDKNKLPLDIYYWIGLSQEDSGSWRWTDGSLLQWDGWAEGEPDADSGTENCAQAHTDYTGWFSKACDAYRSFICRVQKAPPTTLGIPSTTSSSNQYTESETIIPSQPDLTSGTPDLPTTTTTARVPTTRSSTPSTSPSKPTTPSTTSTTTTSPPPPTIRTTTPEMSSNITATIRLTSIPTNESTMEAIAPGSQIFKPLEIMAIVLVSVVTMMILILMIFIGIRRYRAKRAPAHQIYFDRQISVFSSPLYGKDGNTLTAES